MKIGAPHCVTDFNEPWAFIGWGATCATFAYLLRYTQFRNRDHRIRAIEWSRYRQRWNARAVSIPESFIMFSLDRPPTVEAALLACKAWDEGYWAAMKDCGRP